MRNYFIPARRGIKKGALLTLALIFASLQLISCSSSSYDTAAFDVKSEPQSAQSMPGELYEETSAFGAAEYYTDENASISLSSDSNASVSSENDLKSRKIIKNASLSFQTQSYDEFMEQLYGCISSCGGYIESSENYGNSLYSSRSSRNSYITARIPADSYDRFISESSSLGTLTYSTESSTDVTMTYVDTESRIKALEAEYETLLELIDKAESLDDVISLQSRITEVSYQLDSYKSQLRAYDNLISYCTVNIDVSEVYREIQPESEMSYGERIVQGLRDTFESLGEDITDFSVWLVTNLPYIVIWAVLIAVFILIIRLIVRRHRKKKNDKLVARALRQAENESKNGEKDN